MKKQTNKKCGTCMHKTFKHTNWWNERKADGGTKICLIFHKEVSRFDDACEFHSGLSKKGWHERKEYERSVFITT